MYRYRCEGGTTSKARESFRHLAKIGTPLGVRAYRYLATRKWLSGRIVTWEVVMVKGTLGTARFSGLCWGYGGEGPHGTYSLLLLLGVPEPLAYDTAFHSRRPIEQPIQTDWQLVRDSEGQWEKIRT